jgi:hypothetical protein
MERVPDGKSHAPATLRNRGPILEVLRRVLPEHGTVLEIASGTGEHAAWFASRLPELIWQPSDRDPDMRRSMDAYRTGGKIANMQMPLAIDAESDNWGVDAADAIVCINMIHVAPWSACAGLMAGAARTLKDAGILYLYGPFKRGGRHTAPTNEAFDNSLRAHNPDWGVRDLDEVAALAERNGLRLGEVIEMPANNLSVIFRRD